MRTLNRKILSVISSLKAAVILLILITLYIIVGTLLPQHATPSLYEANYPTLAPVIDFLSLDAAYASPLFITLIVLFIINLTSCTFLSLPSQIRRSRPEYYPAVNWESEYLISETDEKEVSAFLKKRHFSRSESDGIVKAGKYRWGALGSTVTHIGIIVIFIGAIMGNVTADEDMITMLPGNTEDFEEYGFSAHLDDFYLTFEESGAVKQYISEITITDDDGTVSEHALWVNNPLHHNGLGFYQANFGWTSNLLIRNSETGEELVSGLMRNGKSYFHQPNHLSIMLYSYFPNMEIDGTQMPYSLSNEELNPYYAVVLSQLGTTVGSYILEPGQVIPFEDIAITFTHSVPYTGLVVRSDPSYPVVLTGFLILTFGMFMSFYLYPRFIFYREGKLMTVSGKNGWVFNHSVKSDLKKMKNKGKE